MSTLLRQTALKALRVMGVKSFKARSSLGYPFVCHVGDFAGEAPFYNRAHSRAEIEFMSRWCSRHPNSLVFDVGANLGFMATQLAQAAKTSHCRIVAFEPVYQTFAKLTEVVEELGLQSQILPVCCAVSDHGGGICSVAFNAKESLFAQVRRDSHNPQGGSLTWCPEVTLDSVAESLGAKPALIKIDVEGREAHVLRGARGIMQSADPPLICFELNPKTLPEVGSSVRAVANELGGYRFFYLDDFEGQRIPPGQEVVDLESLPWTCNLVAAPHTMPQNEMVALFNQSGKSPVVATYIQPQTLEKNGARARNETGLASHR